MTPDPFPNHPEAKTRAHQLGVNPTNSYRRWMLELAGPAAFRVLQIESAPDDTRTTSCVVCGQPVAQPDRGRRLTCSPACRNRKWRNAG